MLRFATMSLSLTSFLIANAMVSAYGQWHPVSGAADAVFADSPAPIAGKVRVAAGREQRSKDERGDREPHAHDNHTVGPVPLGGGAAAGHLPEFDKETLRADWSMAAQIDVAGSIVAQQLASAKARTVPLSYAEVEIRLGGRFSLDDVRALPQAPGGVIEELDDPWRVVVQLPTDVVGRLMKEGAEMSERRRFVFVQGGQVDLYAGSETDSTAGSCVAGTRIGQNDSDVDIPDTNTWVSSAIALSGADSGAIVTCLDVHYEIIHPFIGDLNVDLDDQDLTFNYDLWGPGQGGPTDNLNQTVIDIHTFDGELVNQTWRLYARDEVAGDTGYIDTWWIKVFYDAPVTIYDAWWTEEVDPDGDGYRSSTKLNWDPDVHGCNGSVTVFEKVYWMGGNNGAWNLINTTSPHTLTDCATSDIQSLSYGGGTHDLYDWKIEIYRTGEHFSPDYTRDPTNDPDLDDYPMEQPSEEQLPTVWGAWWSNELDQDGDGCVRSARFHWDTDVSGCGGSLSVVDKVYWKPAASTIWTQIAEAGPRTINDCSSTDSLSVDLLYGSVCGPFDYKIEVYYAGESSPAVTAGPADDPDLNGHQEELDINDCSEELCSDGTYCNGTETCDLHGNCQAGSYPCPGGLCRESDHQCVECLNNNNCADGAFCNGTETCDAGGVCQSGAYPCSTQLCRESDDQCVDCLSNSDCDDALHCNGLETCDAGGLCVAGADPCPGQMCREVDDVCVACLAHADCSDGLWCTGPEACDSNGVCQGGVPACPPELFCVEPGDVIGGCYECLTDAHCMDPLYCNGVETCDLNGACQPGAPPCLQDETCVEDGDRCAPDCNGNDIDDQVDLGQGTSRDCNSNGVPDECDPDNDGDSVPDDCDLCPGFDDSADGDEDGVPDGCDDCPDTPLDEPVDPHGCTVRVDLVVTDLWFEGGTICYQLRNIGSQTAPPGHTTHLSVDGAEAALDEVLVELGPNGRLNRCFDYTWVCNAPRDALRATANHDQAILEFDSTNNSRAEEWNCDTRAPVITSGPSIISIGQASATAIWETDENADSVATYSAYAGGHALGASSPSMVLVHTLPLTGLSPSTTYSVIASSSDASENRVFSRPVTFTTLPTPDPGDPEVTIDETGPGTGVILLSAQASDNHMVDKVEWYIDNVLSFIDYALPFTYPLDTRLLDNGSHLITTRAFDLAGNSSDDQASIDVVNLADLSAPVVTITTPTQDSDVLGKVKVTASLTDDTGLISARFYVDGVYSSFKGWDVSNPPTNATVTFDWNTRQLSLDTRYRLAVEAYDKDGKVGRDTVDVTVVGEPPPPEPPRIVVTSHEVSRLKNVFTITLTVKNEGNIEARNIQIFDGLHEFQPISENAGQADFWAKYNPQGKWGYMDIRPKSSIAPGDSRIYTYKALPVLSAPNPRIPGIGVFVDLYWDSPTQKGFHSYMQLPIATTLGGESIPQAHTSALAQCDYLIVTNPYRVFVLFAPGLSGTPLRNANAVLSTMAELAQLKRGALGYFDSRDSKLLRKIISPSGDWAKKMAPSFTTPLGGYFLIVGEVEIINSWYSSGWDISWSGGATTDRTDYYDGAYADTNADWAPELVVGRIIGNDAVDLTAAMQASIDVFDGTTTFNYRNVLAVSGTGNEQGTMVSTVDAITNSLSSTTFNATKVHWKDFAAAQRFQAFNNQASNKDYIYVFAHGNPTALGALHTGNVPSVNLGGRSPVLFATSCTTGDYEAGSDNNLAEAFFDRGAGAYIGSTELSHISINSWAGKAFFKEITSLSTPGKLLAKMERLMKKLGHKYRFWVAEYNFYGDPKFAETVTAARTAPLVPTINTGRPVSSVIMDIPAFEVDSREGLDFVEIPGGQLLAEDGRTLVPSYLIDVEYPAGYMVQDVVLAQRSGLTTGTGLNIPITPTSHIGPGGTGAIESSHGEGWYPEVEYKWEIAQKPDGSSTLGIVVYPFRYNTLTTNFEFHNSYRFDIRFDPTLLAITQLSIERDQYAVGEIVPMEIGVSAGPVPQDLIVSGTIGRYSLDDGVDGLFLRTLTGAVGPVQADARWDSTGYEPGDYYVQVELLSTDGVVLDSRAEAFALGILSVELRTLSVTPDCLGGTAELAVDLRAENVGSVTVNGSATVKVLTDVGSAVMESTYDITDLSPSTSVEFHDTVDIAGSLQNHYSVVGYVVYNGRATEIVNVDIAACLFGDHDVDGYVDASDFIVLHQCIGGPGVRVEQECLVFDANDDGDVDLGDVRAFVNAFSGAG